MSRPQVLAIPGLLSDEFVWRAQAAALRHLADVTVAELGGDGDGDDLDDLTDMARAALGRVDGPEVDAVHVLGHSMGGRIALEVWRVAPGRVRTLVLLDTGVHPAAPDEPQRRQAVLDAAAEGMDVLADAWLPQMVHPERRVDEAFMAPLREMVCRSTPERHARQIAALLNRPDASALLGTITVPTLVIVGRQDEWSPLAQHEAIAAQIPGAVLEIVEDAGHIVTVEQPDAVSALLVGWISQHGGVGE